MAAFGLADELAKAPTEVECEEEKYPVWTDNWPTVCLFLRLHSKWYVHSAPDGELIRSGIRPEAIEHLLRNTVGIGRREWPTLILDLEAMENAALLAMAKVRNSRRTKRDQELEALRQKLGIGR